MSPEEMERELQRLQAELRHLDQQRRELERQLAEARAEVEIAPPTTAVELERTLHRMFQKFARYLQAERCLFMIHNPEENKLFAHPPAIGFETNHLEELQFPPGDGIAWSAFNERHPFLINDLSKHASAPDVRKLVEFGVKNLLAVPLIWEKRDEDQRVTERKPIGVLLVMDKRRGDGFLEEDRRILEILARQCASVIVGARIYMEIQEEKRRLERTFESLVAGVIMVSMNGRIGLINQTAQQAFCSSTSDGVGKRYDDVIENENVRRIIESALREQAEISEEIEVTGLENHIYRAQTALVRDEQDNVLGIVAIFTDITEIRSLERLKSEFVSTVSHELRTPLTSIKGFISTLLEDQEGYFDHETCYEFYQIIDQECDRLRRLIDDLLNLSRIERGIALQPNWQKVELSKVIERVLSTQQLYTDKHDLLADVPHPLPLIVADEDALDRILTNLVNNAIKYSPDGGKVTVRAVRQDDSVLVSVSDQGIGIPPDKLQKVFERFERIDTKETRQAGGTGLGLHLVKHLVEAHEGTIWVESEPGVGSTFTFRLPIYPQRARDEGYVFENIE